MQLLSTSQLALLSMRQQEDIHRTLVLVMDSEVQESMGVALDTLGLFVLSRNLLTI